MGKHTHRAIKDKTRTVGYQGPVSRNENPIAHGNICDIDTCACGAERRTNRNAGQEERGPWVEREV